MFTHDLNITFSTSNDLAKDYIICKDIYRKKFDILLSLHYNAFKKGLK